jgi:hypothetical protein
VLNREKTQFSMPRIVYKVPTLCNQPVCVVWRYLWVILIAASKYL